MGMAEVQEEEMGMAEVQEEEEDLDYQDGDSQEP
jgi:hypothetical protein